MANLVTMTEVELEELLTLRDNSVVDGSKRQPHFLDQRSPWDADVQVDDAAQLERPAWIAFVQFLQLSCPDPTMDFSPACAIGSAVTGRIRIPREEVDYLNSHIHTMFGPSGIMVRQHQLELVPDSTHQHDPVESIIDAYAPITGLAVVVLIVVTTRIHPTGVPMVSIRANWKDQSPHDCIWSTIRDLTPFGFHRVPVRVEPFPNEVPVSPLVPPRPLFDGDAPDTHGVPPLGPGSTAESIISRVTGYNTRSLRPL